MSLSGLLNFNTTHILEWLILCCRSCPVHWRMFGRILDTVISVPSQNVSIQWMLNFPWGGRIIRHRAWTNPDSWFCKAGWLLWPLKPRGKWSGGLRLQKLLAGHDESGQLRRTHTHTHIYTHSAYMCACLQMYVKHMVTGLDTQQVYICTCKTLKGSVQFLQSTVPIFSKNTKENIFHIYTWNRF